MCICIVCCSCHRKKLYGALMDKAVVGAGGKADSKKAAVQGQMEFSIMFAVILMFPSVMTRPQN